MIGRGARCRFYSAAHRGALPLYLRSQVVLPAPVLRHSRIPSRFTTSPSLPPSLLLELHGTFGGKCMQLFENVNGPDGMRGYGFGIRAHCSKVQGRKGARQP